MKKKYEWYTVVLLYPDYCTDDYGQDVSVQWVRVANDGCDKETLYARAADKARKQCVKDNESGEFGDPPSSDLLVNLVFRGRLKCVADSTWGL